MLVIHVYPGQPLWIGGSLVIVKNAGNRIKVVIDGEDVVFREDVMEGILQEAGFVKTGLGWQRGGKTYTLKEAMDEHGRDSVDASDMPGDGKV